MEWENVFLESNLIETFSSKAILINMPKKSGYKGYSFWHPQSCCRAQGKNRYLVQISFTKDFKFILKKMGKGKFNFNQVLDEVTLDAEEFKEVLGFGDNQEILDDLKDED